MNSLKKRIRELETKLASRIEYNNSLDIQIKEREKEISRDRERIAELETQITEVENSITEKESVLKDYEDTSNHNLKLGKGFKQVKSTSTSEVSSTPVNRVNSTSTSEVSSNQEREIDIEKLEYKFRNSRKKENIKPSISWEEKKSRLQFLLESKVEGSLTQKEVDEAINLTQQISQRQEHLSKFYAALRQSLPKVISIVEESNPHSSTITSEKITDFEDIFGIKYPPRGQRLSLYIWKSKVRPIFYSLSTEDRNIWWEKYKDIIPIEVIDKRFY